MKKVLILILFWKGIFKCIYICSSLRAIIRWKIWANLDRPPLAMWLKLCVIQYHLQLRLICEFPSRKRKKLVFTQSNTVDEHHIYIIKCVHCWCWCYSSYLLYHPYNIYIFFISMVAWLYVLAKRTDTIQLWIAYE